MRMYILTVANVAMTVAKTKAFSKEEAIGRFFLNRQYLINMRGWPFDNCVVQGFPCSEWNHPSFNKLQEV